MSLRSHFKIPARNDNEDIENYADRAAGEIIRQAEHLLGNEQPGTPEHEKKIIEQLVQFTTTLDSDLAFSILFDATQLKLEQEAKNIIQKAFENESVVRFPFMSNPTLECIEQQAENNSNIVEAFFTNPQWLLSWFEKASTKEISRTIEKYFRPDSTYTKRMLALKNQEIAASTPGYATVCYALINREPLNQSAFAELLPALSNPQVYSSNIPRTAASAQLRIRLAKQFMQDEAERNEWNIRSLQKAGNNKHFVHVPGLPLANAVFHKLDFSGALLNRASFKKTRFTQCDLTYSQFKECKLHGTDFSDSLLIDANFTNGELEHVNFHLTDLARCKLNHATIKNCDFTGANLKEINLVGATLEGNLFICRNKLGMSPDNKEQYIRMLEEEFSRLAKMLEEHIFIAELRTAILQDLLAYCFENKKLKNIGKLILTPAYHHELFAGHRKLRVIKDVVNKTTYAVSGYLWSIMPSALYQRTDEDETAQDTMMETSSQQAIRLAVEKLQAPQTIKRPSPPDKPPQMVPK